MGRKVPVTCHETGESYGSVGEAAAACGVSYHSIYIALRRGTSAGGLHWVKTGDEQRPQGPFKPPRDHPVKCLETGVVYVSASEAARSVHTNPSRILGAATGMAGGFHWADVEGIEQRRSSDEGDEQ